MEREIKKLKSNNKKFKFLKDIKNIIDKDQMILWYYQKNSIRSQDNPINLVFYYNYIKYETDDGYIFLKKVKNQIILILLSKK